ncbi:autotransporter outer membrane beta-barrel domain-containing protein [uncultured Acidaminococcus sp.]|uniref:autotransporter outer membrane beta-barrel domain-containing protein n=1 Tax=uncultured Acidaminococcus sp. TaxID=352152 RepID=UPI0026DD4185|nr:autotransporter outer membrane beta-barrel domain-containing protein [uncultured Acidaminococcus sp.]
MKSKKQLTLALALTLALGGSVPVWAEHIQDKTLTEGDWTLKEKLYMEKSYITADQVSLDGSSISEDETYVTTGPVEIKQSTLEGKNGITFSNLKVQAFNGQGYYPDPDHAVGLQGSTLSGKVITIEGASLAQNNGASQLNGLYAEPGDDSINQKKLKNQLITDKLHIDGVKSNTAQDVYGALLGAVELRPYTKDGKANVIVENVENTTDSPEGTLAFGLVNTLGLINIFNPDQSKDIPFVVTGKTQIRNISSTKGSAVGTVLDGISTYDMDHSHTDFHDLEISDIHGGDLSIGLYGGTGVVNVGNADINMTGKDNEYAGLYTASAPDYKSANLKQFAIAGPFLGKFNLNNPEGNYTINGNVLADTGNKLPIVEAEYQFYKKQLDDPKTAKGQEEYLEAMVKGKKNSIQAIKERQYGSINLAGHLKLYGDIYAKNGGTVNLHLQDGSYFEGQADDYADFDAAGQLTPRQVDVSSDLNNSAFGKRESWKSYADDAYASYGVPRLNAGTINLTMDPGSKWQTRGKSFITSLDFNHGGLVDTRKGHGVSVSIGKLTGEGGTFLMDFSKDAAKSDMIYVKDLSQSGVQHIQAYLQPDTKVEELKGIRFATTGGDDYKRDPAAKFDVSLAKDQGINNVTLKVKNEKFNPEDTAANEKFNGGKNGVGTYKPGNDYVTATFSGKGFTKEVPDQEKIMTDAMAGKQTTDDAGNLLPEYLKTKTIENPVKEGTNWFVDEAVVTPSNNAKVIKKSMQLNYMNAIYGVYTDSLEKRLGEARYSGDGDGMWARIRHDRVGRDSLYEANNTMTELGFDWRNDRTKFGRHIQGAALDYMDGSADYKEVTGRSDSKRYGLWFYDTRLGDKGHYTDIVAKYGRLQNEYTLYPEMGGPVKGDSHNDYWSLSFEYGRKKPLASNWFIEPQAQLQYTYLGSTDYRTSQGTQVDLAGTDSLISRLGFRLGKDVSDRTSFYITGDFFHEFLGNQDVSAWDRTGRMDVTGHNDGSWYNAGLGFTTRVGKNSYAYASFDRSFGPHVDRTWTLEAGVNCRF